MEESKNVQTTPTRTFCKRSRPLPYCNQNCRTPRHCKFTQHHRTTRPPPVPRKFLHRSVSNIEHRQLGACCACSKCGTFLFAPLLVIALWPQYREKIVQHMLRAIAVLHFPICALKSCPAPAALAAGAGDYFSLTAYNLTF